MASVLRLFTPRALLHRLNVLRITFQDHQFERNSPLSPLPENLLEAVYSCEVVLPPRKYIEQPGGQTLEGLFFLAALAKTLDARRMFEFGTFNGVTTWTLAKNVPGAIIETLDLPVGEKAELPVEQRDKIVRGFIADHLYAHRPHDAEVNQLWGDSAAFEPSENRREQFDLIYVDGAHSEAYVRGDTANALYMLSSTGVVVWDDYWRDVAGVRAVLHEMQHLGLYRVPRTRLVIHLTEEAKEKLLRR